MKLMITFAILVASFTGYAQNSIEVYAKLVPDAGSFTAKSGQVRGYVVKKGNVFTAEKISVLVSTFVTENKLRDKHFAEHIAGGKALPYPKVELTNLKAQDGKGNASIKINNITRPVQIKYTVNKKLIEAEFNLNAKNFKLPKVNYLGIGVADEVKVNVTYEYVEAP